MTPKIIGLQARSRAKTDAIWYALNHRAGLVQFLNDGRIEIESGTIERDMPPVKRSLIVGSAEDGANWAPPAWLIKMCKLHGVNTHSYFTDLLTRLVNGWPKSSIDELMPWCWAPTTPHGSGYTPPERPQRSAHGRR